MQDSILQDIKKLLGIEYDIIDFDHDLVMYINSVFMTLNQMGVGPKETFSINNSSAIWADFLGENSDIEAVKTYVYFKVKKMFDPATNSTVSQANDQIISELEWRLNSRSDFQNN